MTSQYATREQESAADFFASYFAYVEAYVPHAGTLRLKGYAEQYDLDAIFEAEVNEDGKVVNAILSDYSRGGMLQAYHESRSGAR